MQTQKHQLPSTTSLRARKGAPQGGLSCPFGAIHLLAISWYTVVLSDIFVKGTAPNQFVKLELDGLKLKHSFHKYFIPRVRYLNKTELLKKLSGSIITLNIAH